MLSAALHQSEPSVLVSTYVFRMALLLRRDYGFHVPCRSDLSVFGAGCLEEFHDVRVAR